MSIFSDQPTVEDQLNKICDIPVDPSLDTLTALLSKMRDRLREMSARSFLARYSPRPTGMVSLAALPAVGDIVFMPDPIPNDVCPISRARVKSVDGQSIRGPRAFGLSGPFSMNAVYSSIGETVAVGTAAQMQLLHELQQIGMHQDDTHQLLVAVLMARILEEEDKKGVLDDSST